MSKSLVDFSQEELESFLEIIEVPIRYRGFEFKIREKSKEKVLISDKGMIEIKITRDGIVYKNSTYPDDKIKNAFKAAQYLIDQGYRFDYSLNK
ncbi:MAG: hypothetical protein KC516_02350 [Nanoarchaeota archaeon]|nr:hypothetical protein [Nanoarchaeota archaeon]